MKQAQICTVRSRWGWRVLEIHFSTMLRARRHDFVRHVTGERDVLRNAHAGDLWRLRAVEKWISKTRLRPSVASCTSFHCAMFTTWPVHVQNTNTWEAWLRQTLVDSRIVPLKILVIAQRNQKQTIKFIFEHFANTCASKAVFYNIIFFFYTPLLSQVPSHRCQQSLFRHLIFPAIWLGSDCHFIQDEPQNLPNR